MKPAVDPLIAMLRCGPSDRPFAATAKSGDWRIHRSRTERPCAGAADATAEKHCKCGARYSAAQRTSPDQSFGQIEIQSIRALNRSAIWHLFRGCAELEFVSWFVKLGEVILRSKDTAQTGPRLTKRSVKVEFSDRACEQTRFASENHLFLLNSRWMTIVLTR